MKSVVKILNVFTVLIICMMIVDVMAEEDDTALCTDVDALTDKDKIKIQHYLHYQNFSQPYVTDEFTAEQVCLVFQAAMECLHLYTTSPNLKGDNRYCPITFDGWKCWNYTETATEASQKCPSYIPRSHEERNTVKMCNADGTWYINPETNLTWTDYTDCYYHVPPPLKGYIYVYYVGYSLSVLSCCIALFIFCYFKSLACPRVTMHKNLFLAFILHGIIYLILLGAFLGNKEVLTRNGLECKFMLMLWLYFQVCGYFWMLCEGIYLHLVVVVAVMSTQNTLLWYYVVGWVIPLLFIIISAICKSLLTNENDVCWLNDSPLEWITAAPIIAVLVINFLMLLNILRVLISKLQSTHTSANSSYRRAARATLILVPLLGLHYIIVPMRVLSDDFYAYFMAICLSFQGFFVACIFCFFNAEVKTQIIRRWFNYTVNRKSKRKYTRNSTLTHTSMTECSNTTPQNSRRRDAFLQDNNRPNGSIENSPPLGNGRLLTDANSNTKIEKQSDVDTPLIDGNLLNSVEIERENDFKTAHSTRLDSGYCDVQIDTAV
ncbi:calcitonin gene-related peptide type 1 receptor-like [Antedon mediterranea]|uniref:calcitonin gene-related peptide type 1 receptor-like n=1 Tax=Antedon mediterranea TaxID=105859 RepID=UPI003AF573D7